MKKLFFFLIPLVMWSCSQDEALLAPTEPQPQAQAQVSPLSRSVDEAIAQAINDRSKMLGITTHGSRADLDVRIVTSGRNSRSGGDDTLLYVVNYPDEQGYAVIPRSKSIPTLAVTEEGSFTSIDDMENPTARDYMKAATGYAAGMGIGTSDSLRMPLDPEPYLYLQFDTIREVNVPAKIKMRWGQAGSLAKFTSNGRVGCVPLACALTLSHFEEPKTIQLTFPNRPVESSPLFWWEMKKHVKEFDVISDNKCHCTASETAHEQLARLSRELGMLCNATYNYENGEPATRAPLTGAYSTLTRFLPSTPIIMRNNMNSFRSDVQNGILLMDGSGTGRHCWICDGYYYLKYECNSYRVYPGIASIVTDEVYKEYIETLQTVEIEYMHVNWGWDGMDNGFYNFLVFDNNNPMIRDNKEDGKAERRIYTYINSYIYVQAK